jgi:hypothetical protein
MYSTSWQPLLNVHLIVTNIFKQRPNQVKEYSKLFRTTVVSFALHHYQESVSIYIS